MRTEAARKFDALIKSRGLSLTAAAREIGVRHPTVLRWRTGAKRPTAFHRLQIARWSNGEIPESSWMTAAERRVIGGARAA